MTKAEIEAKIKLKDEMTAALRKINAELKGVGVTAKKSGKSLKEITEKVSFKNLAKSVIGGQLALQGLAGAVRMARKQFGMMVSASSRAKEVQNLFEVSFGEMAVAAEDWATRTQEAIGVNDTTLKEMSGTLFNMVSALGLSKDAAFEMSTGMTQLALDTASFFNLPFDVAFQKIRAGLAGETEPLKQLGVLVTEAAMNELDWVKAMKASGEKLSIRQKTMAASELITKGLVNAQGDLIRTQDSWSNATRLLEEAWIDLLEQLGLAVTDSRTLGVVISTVRESIKSLTAALKESEGGFTLMATEGIQLAIGVLREFLELMVVVTKGIDLITSPWIPKFDVLTEAMEGTAKALDKLQGKITDVAGAELEGTNKAQAYQNALKKVTVMGKKQTLMFHQLTKAGWTATDALQRVAKGNKEVSTEAGKAKSPMKALEEIFGEMSTKAGPFSALIKKTGAEMQTASLRTGTLTLGFGEMQTALDDMGFALKDNNALWINFRAEQQRLIPISEELTKHLGDNAREMTNTKSGAKAASAGINQITQAMGGMAGDLASQTVTFVESMTTMSTSAISSASNIVSAFITLGSILAKIGDDPYTQERRAIHGLLEDSKAYREELEFFASARVGAFSMAAIEELEKMNVAVGEAISSLGEYFAYLADAENLNTDQVSAGVGVMLVAFREAMALTGNLIDTFAMLGPGFEEFINKLKDTGLTAVDSMAELYAFVEDNEAVLGAISDLTTAVQFLGESGLLTAEDLEALGAAAEAEFAKLIASGADMSVIIAAIGPQLAALYQQYQAMGVDIPPWLSAIEEDLKGIEPPRSTEDIMRSIEEAVWALAEAFGVANTNAGALSSTITGMPPPPTGSSNPPTSPNVPPGHGSYVGAATGMFEKLKNDTMILAHAGELVNILPKMQTAKLGLRTAQQGIPDFGGSLPPEITGGGGAPDYIGGALPPELGGGGGAAQHSAIQSLGKAIAASMKPSVHVSSTRQIDVRLPEKSAHRYQDTFREETLPLFLEALRNDDLYLTTTIREVI